MREMIPESTAASGNEFDELRLGFISPPDDYRPVPFWWWVGEPLDRERLAWQLDALKSKGISNAIISYNHNPDGSSDPGDPPVFSAAWWELFRWIVSECKIRGMKISFQDYTLLNPILQRIGRDTPGMQGGQLKEISSLVEGVMSCRLALEPGCRVIAASAYPLENGVACVNGRIDLTGALIDGELSWQGRAGAWLVSVVYFVPGKFDPMHPQSAEKIVEQFYSLFEKNCPGELGKTIPILFQDELDFGDRMPLWSSGLGQEFLARKGYELAPLLPALWHDFGPVTAKVRIDYSGVVTKLLEENYFIPVFRWAESHGVFLANDNAGRGMMDEGRKFYGDYFRAMRWFNAPGCDDPRIDYPRAFKGLKVNSSIAHLYKRQRVWNECFHSSGWGVTPARVVAALNEDFAYGATVVNLHGLYYSTYGGWWEWASPDFHFRQPYWQHMAQFNDYASRLSFILSQGVHVCDVAIVYPITSIEAGLGGRIPDPLDDAVPYSEAQAGKQDTLCCEEEAHAFGIGRTLTDAGLDFDFVDFESLEKAKVCGGRLCVSGEEYRVLILPAMKAVRFSTLLAAREFQRNGGLVIAYGCLPFASEKRGSNDDEVAGLVREIFHCDSAGHGLLIADGYGNVKEAIDAGIMRDFIPMDGHLCVLHRRVGGREIYYVFNRMETAYAGEVFFRATGSVCRWDPRTGARLQMEAGCAETQGTRLRLDLAPFEAQIIVFGDSDDYFAAVQAESVKGSRVCTDLDGLWECELRPTMDNRYGDFRLPAHAGMIGVEARQFRYAEEALPGSAWHLPGFDDSAWPLKTFSFGPRFLVLGPIPPAVDLSGIEKQLASLANVCPSEPVMIEGKPYSWMPHEISLRWGIENDPFLKDWASGPHGLKKDVPLEFIDLDCSVPGSTWYVWSTVPAEESRRAPMVMGSRASYFAWLNGRSVMSQAEALPPGRQSQWNLPHYNSSPREVSVELKKGFNPLLVKYVQPGGQRVRAYVAFDPPPEKRRLGLRWFSVPGRRGFNCFPKRGKCAGWYRFASPPGLTSLSAVIRGNPRVWVAGEEMTIVKLGDRDGGGADYRVDIPKPAVDQVAVAIRVELEPGSFAGDAFPEPVAMECGRGRIRLGDWSQYGLGTYSGVVKYARELTLKEKCSGELILDLGELAGTAEVLVNGRSAGILVSPPWRLRVTDLVQDGANVVEVIVANTLANHYSVGIPTPYVYEGQTVSGLLGPVRVYMGTEQI